MQDDKNTPWQYKPNGEAGDLDEAETDEPMASPAQSQATGSFAWQSVEFIEQPHSSAWYAGLAVVTAGLTALVYFLTKDYVATGTILIVGIIVGVFVNHKPKMVDYEISNFGLKVGLKNYPYSSFKSFSILDEGSLSSINLFPLKRFVPPIAAYFEPADKDKVIKAIGDYLPYEEHRMDSIDRLTRRLHL